MKNRNELYSNSHPILIEMLEKVLKINFNNDDATIISGYEEKNTKISSFTDIIIQMANRYTSIKGVNEIRLLQHKLIDCIHLYREDSFFRENNLDQNNKIRLELQKLIDQLYLSKDVMEKLAKMVIIENEDLSNQLDSVKMNVEVLLNYLENKKNAVQFVPTANLL